jgi:hypothetical protein
MKQPRKVALINVADYPRARYSACWQIAVLGSDEEGYLWKAQIVSYTPVGWEWKGKVTPERPVAPAPVYPPDIPVRQDQFLKMKPAQQAEIVKAQEERRALCSRIYEAHPKPHYVLAEHGGTADTRDAADTAAQQWVLKQMPMQRRQGTTLQSFAGVVNPFDMLAALRALTAWVLRPLLMALALATATRNNMLNQIRDAIDAGAGAGLLRIYDGTRPATCGTATTLGAELTHADPCAPGASAGAVTYNAIADDASANATITATWFRQVDSTGTCAVDGNVGTAGSDLNLNSTAIAVGQRVSVTSWGLTAGNP